MMGGVFLLSAVFLLGGSPPPSGGEGRPPFLQRDQNLPVSLFCFSRRIPSPDRFSCTGRFSLILLLIGAVDSFFFPADSCDAVAFLNAGRLCLASPPPILRKPIWSV